MRATRQGLQLGCLLTVVLACNSRLVHEDTAGTPPASPTHHARVEGGVVGSTGEGLESVGVGARYAASSAPERRVSVTGGAYTDAAGVYSFELKASTPKTRDGTADIYVHATKYGGPGQTVVEDSVLVTVQLVPLERVPPVRRAPTIRLPIE